MKLEQNLVPVDIGDKSRNYDPHDIVDRINNLEAEGVAGAKELRKWLTGEFGIEEEAIDLESVNVFCETMLAVSTRLVDERKKKVTETAASLLSSLGFHPITENGADSKKTDGLQTSPESQPSEPETQSSTTTTASIQSGKPKPSSPDQQKPETTPR